MTWKSVTPSFTGDSQHFGGDDGLNKYANLFNGVLDVDTIDINSGWTFRSGKSKFRNPANTFSYTILGAAIAADRNLTLPLSTGSDTLAALGVVQVFTATQTFDTFSDVKQVAVPASPAASYHRLYVDSADGHLKRKDSAGVVSDYDAAAGGGEVNTMSNLTGTAGAVGVFKQKTGVNFEMKKINAGSAYITITDDTGNNEVDVGVGTNVATLNTGQTFTSAKTFDLHTDLKQITAPANPSIAYHRLYVDSTDSHLKRKDSVGTIKDYDAGTGAGGGTIGGSVTTTYDPFASTYNITTDDSLSPNSLWRLFYHGIHPDIYSVPAPGDGSIQLITGVVVRYGIQINGATGELVGMALKSWTVRLKKAGTPTGNVTATIRNAADTVVATFTETPLASSLTTSFADFVFTLTSPHTIADGERILIEYAGAGSVYMELFITDQFNTSLTRRTSYNGTTLVYIDSSGADICGSMSIVDAGQVGVRVPAGGAFPRVMYEYPYSVTNKTSDALNVNGYIGSSASLVLTEGPYYGDFDITFSVRTVAQKRGTPATPNAWESVWIMFRFNEAQGVHYHHYYLTLKSNGTLELGRKDNAVSIDEQYFLDTTATYSYSAGTWYKVRIKCTVNLIEIWLDDIKKITFSDDGHLGPQGGAPNTPAIPSTYMLQGKIGLYNEDAEVEMSPMQVTSGIGLVQAYNYLIYTQGTNYYAQNGITNQVEFSGASLKTVLDSVVAVIPAQGGTVRFAPGDFSLTTQWTPTQSNITYFGSGVDSTRILYDMGSTGAGIHTTGTVGSFNSLTANSLKDTRTVTIASTAGFTAGDWIYIKRNVSMQSIGTDYYDAEFHRISAVTSGTVLTLDIGLFEDYTTAFTSTLAKVNWISNVMFRDMTIYDNRSGVSNLTEQGDTVFNLCKDINIQNVKFENGVFAQLTITNCFNVDLNNVYYITTRQNTSSTIPNSFGYGIHILSATTNLTSTGGFGYKCRHVIDTDMNSGGTYATSGTTGGRPRNIIIQGMKSYHCDAAHYNTHQGTVGITFANCGAIGGFPGPDVGSTTEVFGFGTRSPITMTGCYTQGAYTNAVDIDTDDGTFPVGTANNPQSDRTLIVGCRFENTVEDVAFDTGRGIRITTNRANVIINSCIFNNIPDECIDIRSGVKNVIINNCVFNSCAGDVGSGGGYIRILTTATDIIIKDNVFGAGTPSPAARPLWVGTSVTRLLFADNDVQGLTNKMPSIPAASIGVNIRDNMGLNPINKITNPFNTTSNTFGVYGGTSAAPISGVDYTIVGGTIFMTMSGGTAATMIMKDGAGNILTSETPVPSIRTMYPGYKVNFTFTSAPTVNAYGW